MPILSIPTYATGDTIEASWANTLRDNGLLLDGRTGGDPGAADKLLVSTGALGAGWSQPAGDTVLADSSVTGNSAGSAIGANVIDANRIVPNTFNATQVDSAFATDSFSIANVAKIIQDAAILAVHLAVGAAAANLGYMPVNKAGDTGIGGLASTGTVSALGLVAGSNGIAVGVGGVATTGQIASTMATGTPPLSVTSTTPVANLSVADSGKLGGVAPSGYPTLAGGGNFTTAPTINSIGFGTANEIAYGPLTGSLTCTTSLADIPGMSVTVGRAGSYLLIGEANFTTAAGEGVGQIQLDISGVASGQLRNCGIGLSGAVNSFSGVVMFAASLAAGVTVKLRGVKSSGAGSTQIVGGTLIAVRITN